MTRSFLLLVLSGSLIYASGRFSLAYGMQSPDARGREAQADIREKVESFSASKKLLIRLKSNEKISGEIIERKVNAVILKIEKTGQYTEREIAYSEIKTIKEEQKISTKIKVVSVIASLSIITLFLIATNHRGR